MSTQPLAATAMAAADAFEDAATSGRAGRSLARGGWTVVLPEDAVLIDLPRGAGAGRRLRRALDPVPPGSPVAIVSRFPVGRAVLTRVAARAGLVISRQLIALPKLGRTCYLVEDEPAMVRWILQSVLTVPPGVTRAPAIGQVGVRVIRDLLPAALVTRLLPHRVALGVKL